MDKIAQQRTWQSIIRDKLNFSGKIIEELNIEFAQVMTTLRDTDANIREDASDLKKLATNAVKLVRARHYLDVAVNITGFHERCRLIAAKLAKFSGSVDLRHYSYLLDQLPEADKEKLFSYDPSKKITLDNAEAADFSYALIKQAAFTDWLFPAENAEPNSRQNSAMRGLEKRFKIPLLKNLKAQSISMTEKTYQFYKYLIVTFKKLGWVTSTRKVDKYVEISNEFIRKFAEYHNHFISYYEKNIKPLKEHQEKMRAEQAAKAEAAKPKVEAPQARSPFPQATPSHLHVNKPSNGGEPGEEWPIPDDHPFTSGKWNPFDQTLNDETNRAPLFPQPGPKRLDRDNPGTKGELRPIPPTPEENIPVDLKRKAPPMNLRDRPIMSSFIAKLEKLASEDRAEEMLSAILKQSEVLEDTDVEQSMQLLSIAEGMLEDKTAGVFDFWKKKDEEDAKEDEKRLPLASPQL